MAVPISTDQITGIVMWFALFLVVMGLSELVIIKFLLGWLK